MAGVEVDFGAGPRTLDASTRVLGLTPGRDGLVAADGPIDWSALAALPNVITINWSGPERGILDPAGLRRTPTVWIWVGGEVSARVLADLVELADLRITFDKPPGVLTDLAELGRHHPLQALRLDDAYGLDPRGLPELPSLGSLELSGSRDTIAAALQARFRDTDVDISVDGAMSEAWLAEHMDNPFRDWVEDSEEFATAACAAYNRAVRAGSPATAESVLRAFVADLSAINDEYDLIDTGERDHAWTVFHDLGRRWQVPEIQLDEWFDDGRRF